MNIKGKNVLVTGGAGFIPSHLVDLVVEEGGNATAIDNLRVGKLENLEKAKDEIHFEKIDVRNYEEVQRIFKEQQIEIVFHFAANANVPYSIDDPTYDFETNVIGTFNVIKCCLHNNVGKVVYASSAAVYGEPKYVPIDESHPLNPISPYGASKLAGERLGFAYYHTYGLPFVSLRIFNTYGPRQPRYVLIDFLKKLQKDPDRLEVLGTGEQIRDYCYVTDTAKACIMAACNDMTMGEAFNIAGGNPISIRELADLTIRLLGLEGSTKIYFTGKSWKGDISKLAADISKIRRLGFSPKTGLEEGLMMTIEWFKDHNRSFRDLG